MQFEVIRISNTAFAVGYPGGQVGPFETAEAASEWGTAYVRALAARVRLYDKGLIPLSEV